MAYTYLIGWTKYNKFYYGVRYAKGCNENDLWVTYFSSSTYVDNFRKQFGEPDIVEVRKVFQDAYYAIRCEDRIIRTLKLFQDERFLNKAYSGSIYYDEDVRKKMSDNAKKPRSEKYKQSRSTTMKRMWEEGIYDKRPPQSVEHKKKNSDRLKERYSQVEHHSKNTKLSAEHKKKISNGVKNSKKYKKAMKAMNTKGKNNPMYGKKHSEETKEKIRQKALQRKKLQNV